MAEIILTNVTKRWGGFYGVDNLNLVIRDNAFVTLLGPSGCGKTTTLRMIAGLETPTEGRITIDGVPVFDSELGINVPANKRKVGFLFQNYALWPNMTVYQNISFGLSNIKEMMPTVNQEAYALADQIKALKQPEALAEAIRENLDPKNTRHTLQRLSDLFDLSQDAAKTLLDSGIHQAADPGEAADSLRNALQARMDSIRQAHATKGETLNERFEVMKGGQVQETVRKLNREEIDRVVRRVSRIVKIGMFMDRYPNELSGGQQQRVAIARTLAPGPKVLFMDEPLSNLDAKLRLEMRSELQRLHLETGSTFIYVTHDQMEAMTLASEVCLLDNGLLQQYDKPLTLYNRPGNLFAADFVGNPAINFIKAEGKARADGSLELKAFDGLAAEFIPAAPLDLPAFFKKTAQEEVKAQEEEKNKAVEKVNKQDGFRYRIVKVEDDEMGMADGSAGEDQFLIGIRPEFVILEEKGNMEGEVFSAMPTGMETTVRIRMGDYLLTSVIFGGVLFTIGQTVRFSFHPETAMLFSRKNGQLISLGTLKMK